MFKSVSLVSTLVVSFAAATPGFSQDADAGAKVFKKCKACHQIGEGAENGAGPQLYGIIGRTAGGAEGFKYGRDMVKAGENGLVWTEDLLSDYLADPKKFLREYLDNPKAKAKMAFRLKKEKDRLNVIAYLANVDQ
ncbi:MAG: cytochrome c family protein [Rhodobacteraceae bacterium]|nr:cytochrome c family protein [Paracoccaceae bacterium]